VIDEEVVCGGVRQLFSLILGLVVFQFSVFLIVLIVNYVSNS